jgi:hypothetical protein
MAAATDGTLCLNTEVVMFSCIAGSKAISVCSSPDLSVTTGYMQYRRGALGKEPDLAYPKKGASPQRAFSYFYDGYAKGSTRQLSFTVRDFTYILFSERHVNEWSGSGVVVEKLGKRIATLRCDDKTIQGEFKKIESVELPAAQWRDLGVQRPNSTPHTDARDAQRVTGSPAARAGGRGR